MKDFFNVPVDSSDNAEIKNYLHFMPVVPEIDKVLNSLKEDKLLLFSGMSFEDASVLFSKLVNAFGLQDSYDIQMQLVVHMMQDRESVDEKAVTVNRRGPFQLIQAHSEGDTNSPLELFGLYCIENANHGGENILSHINQDSDFSKLFAKEKVIFDKGMDQDELLNLKGFHLDAKETIKDESGVSRILTQSAKGGVGIALRKLIKRNSIILNRPVLTLWDNVTVHDLAFHKHHYELIDSLGILLKGLGDNSESYFHIEEDSDWAPIDTESGTVEETATLFDYHIIHKMRKGEFLLFNNRTWTHAVSNWDPNEVRRLTAFYA